MRSVPRYGDEPILSVEVRVPGPHPVVRQRARLGEVLAGLSDDEWGRPTRCDAWTVQDVVAHLTGTNAFWLVSIGQGLAGEPTTLLTSFDPAKTPDELVAQQRGTSAAQTLDAFLQTSSELADLLAGLDDEGWDIVAEAAPGHVPIRIVADHALWDCWVHERDILLPLGRDAVVDEAEVLTCLRYVAALGSVFSVCVGLEPPPPVELRTTRPDSRLVVETVDGRVRVHDGPAPLDAAVVELEALPLLELLSRRDPGIAAPEPVVALSKGLAAAFDQPV